jgi:sugar phosphate isomerase/epimerase
MQIGLNLAVLQGCPLEAALDFVCSLAIDAVELNIDSADRLTPLEKAVNSRFLKFLTHAVNTRGLAISAVGNHIDSQLIGGPHHEDTDSICIGSPREKAAYGKKKLLATARIASQLGVDTVIGFTGCEDWSRWFPWPDKKGWERMLPTFVDTWNPILDEMKALGVRFAHEPHPKQMAYNTETAIEVTKALDERAEWGFNLDVANLSLAGVDPSTFIQALPEKIFHVHAKDIECVAHNIRRSGWQAHGAWERRDRGLRFRIPGWGDLNWKSILSELQLVGYRGVISIEHEDPIFGREEGVRKAVEYLQPLIIRSPREDAWW